MSMALPIEGLAPRKDIAPPLLELRGISKTFPGVARSTTCRFAIWPAKCTCCSARTAPASRR